MLFRATHRGTQENDILLGGFVQRHIAAFSEPELAAVEALLDLPENELGDWLTGRLPIPDEVATPMLLRVRDEALHPPPPPPAPPSWPGLARPPTSFLEDIDARARPSPDGMGEAEPPR